MKPPQRTLYLNGLYSFYDPVANEDEYFQEIMQIIANWPICNLYLAPSFLYRRAEAVIQRFMQSIPNNIRHLEFGSQLLPLKQFSYIPPLESLKLTNDPHFLKSKALRDFFKDFVSASYFFLGNLPEERFDGLTTASLHHIGFESEPKESTTFYINLDKHLSLAVNQITLSLYFRTEDKTETETFSRQELSFRANKQTCLNKLAERREFFSDKGQTASIVTALNNLTVFIETGAPENFDLNQWNNEVKNLIDQRPDSRSINKFKETTKAKMHRYIDEIITLTLNISILDQPPVKPVNHLKKDEPENEPPRLGGC